MWPRPAASWASSRWRSPQATCDRSHGSSSTGTWDAANVDLKGFTEDFYHRVCAGRLAPVLETLEYLKHETAVWFDPIRLLRERRPARLLTAG